jgi:hypothetical protein
MLRDVPFGTMVPPPRVHTSGYSQCVGGMKVRTNPLPDIGIGTMIDPKEPIVVNGNDEGVKFKLSYFPVRELEADDNKNYIAKKPVAFSMEFTSPETSAEFFKLMQRALNCADPDETPNWALGLMDYLTGTPSPPMLPKARKRPPEPPAATPAPAVEDDWLHPVSKETDFDKADGPSCNRNDPSCESCQ